MGLKKLTNITPAELKAKGVVSLADKPNIAASYGVGGLSPTSLKLWFDQIGTFVAEKINVIQDILSGESAAQYIRLNLTGLDGEDVTTEHSLQDLCDAFKDGRFCEYMLAYGSVSDSELKSLQAILYEIAQNISRNKELADTAQETIDKHAVSTGAHSDIRNLADERWAKTVTNDRIVDNFNTDVPSMALSASAGKKLNDSIKAINELEKKCVVGLTMDSVSGILTIAYRDGTSDKIDLPLEYMFKDAYYNAETKCIDIVLENGDVVECPVQDLVNEYYGDNETIELNRDNDGTLRFSLKQAIRNRIEDCIAATNTAVTNASKALETAIDNNAKVNTATATANRAKAESETAEKTAAAALLAAQQALERVVTEAGGTVIYENGVAKAVFEVDFIAKACAWAHTSREAEKARGFTKGGDIDRILQTTTKQVQIKLAAALKQVNEAIASLGCVPMANYAGQAAEADVASGYTKAGAIAKKFAELEKRIKDLEA